MCWKKNLQKQEVKNEGDFFFRWLAVELAPTIYGEKPGTILNLMDTSKLSMKTLWLEYGSTLLAKSNLQWIVVKEDSKSLKIFFYRPDLLESYVNELAIRDFLAGFGYHYTMNLEEMLLYFKERFSCTCPHEMGVFLGIPLKDVLGFMGMSEECRTCEGMWQIYGDPGSSLCIMRRMEENKNQVVNWMTEGYAAADVLCGACF